MKVTDEMVERGARALYDVDGVSNKYLTSRVQWEDLVWTLRDSYRRDARVVLEAALGGDESANRTGDD